jgi:hypothetical protein
MADKTIRTYNPAKMAIVWNGIVLTGFAEDTFLKLERLGDGFETSEGADGGIDRVNRNSFGYKGSFTLKQTSPSNTLLMEAFMADLNGEVDTIPTLVVKDLSGDTEFSAQAWIEKDPSKDFGRKMGSREWKIATGIPTVDKGGSN